MNSEQVKALQDIGKATAEAFERSTAALREFVEALERQGDAYKNLTGYDEIVENGQGRPDAL